MGTWGGEPIEWRVLNVSGNTALAISEYGIDCKLFNNDAYKGNSWYSSDLYDWLSNDFLTGAFTEEEQASIREVTCLSMDEAEKYFKDDDDRICYPTAYARQQDVWGLCPTGSDGWWLRSPGRASTHAVLVNHDGYVYSSGNYVNSSGLAVRPALILNL